MTQYHTAQPPSLFRSFWMGGFESASQKLCGNERIDMVAVTQHDRQFAQDYALLGKHGFRTARESLRWYLIDRGGEYHLSSLTTLIEASQKAGVQMIWGLCHYGWPDDIDIFSPAFIDRFARYSKAVAGCIADASDEIPFYNPINEISFFAWAAAEAGFIYPCEHGRAHELKVQLVRAAIAAIEAIWEVDSRARIVHVDPMIQVIAPAGRPDLMRHAFIHTQAQFQSWDMLGGWELPELGGQPHYMDILGINYYHDNQWELERERLSWEERLTSGDSRWLPLHMQLENVYTRYLRPLFVAETSHFGSGRGAWIKMMAGEVATARQRGVPVEGICIYPIIDRPDWHDWERWHNSGLWDLVPGAEDELRRVINREYLEDLRLAQRLI